MHNPFRYFNSVVTLLNGRAANWLRTQAQAAAAAVCHRPIAWLRNWRNVFREIRWRWALKGLCQVNLIDSEISCNILFESSLRSLKLAPAERGGFMQAVARPVPPGHGQSLWHGFACLQERKGRLSAGRPLLLPSLISDQGTWVPGAVSFPLLKAVPFFAGRVNKLVAEVGRGGRPGRRLVAIGNLA